MLITIYVDDIRKCPIDTAVTVRTYNTAIETIEFFASTSAQIILDLDHDLGEERSGYDICKWVVENGVALYGYKIHSMNPVGVANMRQLMNRYGYKEIV